MLKYALAHWLLGGEPMLIKIIGSDLFCNSLYVLAGLVAAVIIGLDLSFGHRRKHDDKTH